MVTFDRDFKRLIRRFPEGTRSRFERHAGRISFTCNERDAEIRIEELLEVIEFHYAIANRQGKRFVMQISKSSVTVVD